MASVTSDFYIDPQDGWVQISAAGADQLYIAPDYQRAFSIYVGSSPSLNDTPASANLSYSGRPTAATKANATLTFEDDGDTGDTVQDGDTILINEDTYTFVDTLSGAPFEVLIGADNSEASANLVAAINGAAGAGVVYSDGLEANSICEASAVGLVVTLTVLLNTSDYDAAPTVATSGGCAFGAATFADAVAGQTITLAGEVFTFVAALSKLSHSDASGLPGEVLAGADAAGDYTNLAAAVNGSGVEGTTYGNGTPSRPGNISATNDGVDDVLFTAGPYDNGIPVSETLSNASFDGSATSLSGGAPAPRGLAFGKKNGSGQSPIHLEGVDAAVHIRVKQEGSEAGPMHFGVLAVTSS